MAAVLITYNTILDAEFLYTTSPESIEEFTKQILIPKYKADTNEGDDWKPPSRTFEEGGDCEDLATFVIAKALSCFADVGFIMMAPESATENSINSTHIAAVIRSDDGQLVVVDLAYPLNQFKSLSLDRYFKAMDPGNLTRYRIWWMLLPNSSQPEIKRIP
jgi:hypothetical protein